MKKLPLILLAYFAVVVVATASIAGKVTDPTGKPIPGAEVSLDGNAEHTVTDNSGQFTLSGSNSVVVVVKSEFLDHLTAVPNPNAMLSIQMIACAATVTDIEGNVYQAVKLGNQIWTVENLRTRKFNDGTEIPFDPSPVTWKDNTTPKYCYPGNTTDAGTIRRFGALYNFYAVDTKKLAPPGWHVPSGEEWKTFETYLIANGFNYDGSTRGDKIAKAISAEISWTPSEVEGAIGNHPASNNRTGFGAMGTGFRHESNIFEPFGRYTGWWTSTPASSDHAGMIDLHFNEAKWSNAHHYRSACGYGVRLVKDTN